MSTPNNRQYSYIDGIDSLALVDGVVRFNLMTITAVTDGKPVATQAGGLAMSLPAMLKIHGQLGQMINELVQKGVLQKNKDVVVN